MKTATQVVFVREDSQMDLATGKVSSEDISQTPIPQLETFQSKIDNSLECVNWLLLMQTRKIGLRPVGLYGLCKRCRTAIWR